MAEEAVIFPPQPMFMVDRGWQRHNKKGRQDSGMPASERHSSRVPEITITVAKDVSAAESIPTQGTRMRRPVDKTVQLQFMNYEPPRTEKPQQGRQQLTLREPKRRTTKHHPHQPPAMIGTSKTDRRQKPFPALERAIAGTASPLYMVIDPEVSGFQSLITYYPTRLAASMFPISKYVPFESNPIKTVWLPAAVTDEVLLHTILFSSALHLRATSETDGFRNSDGLMKVILDRLNRRINAREYSDATIGAISCLALCGNQLGEHDKWAMHMAGMSEMIRVRGGEASIHETMRMKIHRADIIGAVDTLSRPRLRRPVRTTTSLYHTMGLDNLDQSFESMLFESDFSPMLSGALVDLHYLCQALERAVTNQIPINPRAYEEDLICIHHDLLVSECSDEQQLENACRLAALIFMQTIMRERPFVKSASTLLSRELKKSLLALEPELLPTHLFFWVIFMGGLVSARTEESLWYRTKLCEFLECHPKLVSWKDAKDELGKTLWIDCIQTEYGVKLWHDIE